MEWNQLLKPPDTVAETFEMIIDNLFTNVSESWSY